MTGAFFLSLALFFLFALSVLGQDAQSLLDFAIGDTVELIVDSETDPDLWNLKLVYEYFGTLPESTAIKLYDSSCSIELPTDGSSPIIAAAQILCLPVDQSFLRQESWTVEEYAGNQNRMLGGCLVVTYTSAHQQIRSHIFYLAHRDIVFL